MKKMILLLTAPFLLIDACSSAKLVRKNTTEDKVSISKTDTAAILKESITTSKSDPGKQIIIRYTADWQEDFVLRTRFVPKIKGPLSE